jgi:hypothetical protein
MGGFIAPVFVGPLLFTVLGFLIRMMCKLYITQLCRKYGDYKMLFFYKEGWWTLLIMLITEGHLHKDIKNDIWVWCVVIINTMVSQAAILFVIFTPAVPFQSPPHYSGPDFVLFPKQGDGDSVIGQKEWYLYRLSSSGVCPDTCRSGNFGRITQAVHRMLLFGSFVCQYCLRHIHHR